MCYAIRSMSRGRKVAAITLNEDECQKLRALSRRRKTGADAALRASIVIECSKGLTNSTIARNLRTSLATVGKWRRRFAEQRMEGLFDAPRPGQPRKISDAKIEEVVTKTLETKPDNATHWSTRSMAKAIGLNSTAIQRIWKAFGLKPHRSEGFKLSTDPMFVEKLRDVVGLYLNPVDKTKAVVLSVDEKSQIQALNRTQPLLPMDLGDSERQTHDYERNGTTSLFAALDIATGKIIGKCYENHRHQEFISFLRLIEQNVDPACDIHLVLDNYATHKTPAVKAWLLKHPRFHLHFTPTSSSWLNQVERWFAKITTERIRRGTFPNTRSLEKAIYDYIEANNKDPKPFAWVATADVILRRIADKCERLGKIADISLINESGH
jgi:transposase